MRIALRTSGGRGEYELTGAHAGVSASDLFDERLLFELRPDLTIDGRSAAGLFQGKPRIRLDDGGRHAYRVLTDVLLMPLPRRELRETASGQGFVVDRGYAVGDIDVDLAGRSTDGVELRPTRLWLINAEGLIRRVEFAERMAAVQAVWDAGRVEQGRLADFVRAHEEAVEGGDHASIGSAANAVRREVGGGGDVLPTAAIRLGVDMEDGVSEGGAPADEVPDDAIDDETDPDEALRREVAKWRKQASRGAAGRRFSESVKAAYEYRCVFCGRRYPKLDSAATSGVDGAHILPWAKYDLNSVTNGLSLCKTCHWAFDNGILRLDYRAQSKTYTISIPAQIKREAKAVSFDLSGFADLEGRVALWHLPQSEALWPSPTYLAELNRQVYG